MTLRRFAGSTNVRASERRRLTIAGVVCVLSCHTKDCSADPGRFSASSNADDIRKTSSLIAEAMALLGFPECIKCKALCNRGKNSFATHTVL